MELSSQPSLSYIESVHGYEYNSTPEYVINLLNHAHNTQKAEVTNEKDDTLNFHIWLDKQIL